MVFVPDTESPQPSSPFAIPIFRAIWIASLASNFGGLIQSVGAAWMMTSLSASPVLVALVPASTTLPIMLFSLWAGAVADNLDRRKVMIITRVIAAILAGILALATLSDHATLGLIYTLTAIAAGVTPGERVIVYPSDRIAPGVRVEAR